MARFGGNEFIGFSVPLVFNGRYFILEPTNPPLISVFLEVNNQLIFEVLKNQPVKNSISEVTSSGAGIVTVSDLKTKRFLYKVRPSSETSVTFGKLDGGEISAQITDKKIQVGSMSLENNVFSGFGAGVILKDDGSLIIGGPLPHTVLQLLASK